MTSALLQLAELAGIVSEYHDIWGTPHTASDATRLGLLRAMGISCANAEEMAAALADWRARRWRQHLAPVLVSPAGQIPQVRLNLPEAAPPALDVAPGKWRYPDRRLPAAGIAPYRVQRD
jgi:hypothetical protein